MENYRGTITMIQGAKNQDVQTKTIGRDTQTKHIFKSTKKFQTLQFSRY